MGITKDNSTFTCDLCGKPAYAGGIREYANCYQSECMHCGFTTTLSKRAVKKHQKEYSQNKNSCSQNENVIKISTGGACGLECAT